MCIYIYTHTHIRVWCVIESHLVSVVALQFVSCVMLPTLEGGGGRFND